MRITCCKDCPARQLGCHGTCEKYLKEKEAIESQKNIRRKAKAENNMFAEVRMRGIKRFAK